MTSGSGISRREALAAGGVGLVLAGSAAPLSAGQNAIPAADEERGVKVTEATNVALAASPDGAMLALDLLGILWTMPVTGGKLTRLTGDFDDLGQPDWSPDGSQIIVQSYRTGNFHIWSVPSGGGEMIQLTDGACDDREPRWSPDGKWIAFSSDRSEGRYAIHILELATGKVALFSHGETQDSEPCWAPDGKSIAYVADGGKIMVAPLGGGEAAVVASVEPSPDFFRKQELHAPAYGPDGAIWYTRMAGGKMDLIREGTVVPAGDDLYPFRPAWAAGALIYGADGTLWSMDAKGAKKAIAFEASAPVTRPDYARKTRDFDSSAPRPVVGIVAPALSPDGRQIAFGALNDLWLMDIGSAPRKLVSGPSYKCDPAWSPDGKWIAYSNDKGGTLDIWLHELATGQERQLTNLANQGAVSAAWSPEGDLIAFLDQNGALHTVEVASGAVQKVYGALWEPGRPSFGPGGKSIAYAAFKPYSARYREGLSEILTVDRATGKGEYAPVMPGKSIGVRGLDGPVWSPDGKSMAFVFASTLWVVAVDEKGAFAGKPRQITTEVTDAPSWSGDSRSLLYLSNGKLKLVSASGGAAREIPCRLSWANAKPKGRKLVSAPRLWDGTSAGYTNGKDVIVEGNRIAALVPAGSVGDTGMEKVDGSGLTLIPGLIDMHTHRQMQGYNYGDRMGRIWLTMGITATRSPGAPAYHMVEDREAIDSGARIAARHYATGEALDGSRIFYNFMRPVTEPGQMQLELSRARALDYDMIKTYVRMRHDVQAEVVKSAHRMGMHLSSHYHYPALHSGMDCMEHMGATNRYGYSRTITSLGGGYQDVNGLFAAAQAARTPTLFIASVLLGEDDSLAKDERIKTLFPPWEYEKLMGRIKMMTAGDTAPLYASLERQVAQIRQTMEMGWHVITGTDAPIDLVAISLHLNLRGMVRFGIAPVEALKTATSHAGAFLAEPIGRIAPGMLADMVLVEGDPLTNIEDASRVHSVFANGHVHTPETLMAPFAAPSPSATRNAHLPALAVRQQFFWQDAAYVEECRHACCDDHMPFGTA